MTFEDCATEYVNGHPVVSMSLEIYGI